jgi:hypothetical protein
MKKAGLSPAKFKFHLDRLMGDAHRRRFDGVLVWKFDRFTRGSETLTVRVARHSTESLCKRIGIAMFATFPELTGLSDAAPLFRYIRPARHPETVKTIGTVLRVCGSGGCAR